MAHARDDESHSLRSTEVGCGCNCVLRIAYWLLRYLRIGRGRLWMELRIAYWLLRVNAPVKLTLHSIDSYCTAVRVILLTSKFNASNMREREMINRHSNIRIRVIGILV